jgi:hypothetical protein
MTEPTPRHAAIPCLTFAEFPEGEGRFALLARQRCLGAALRRFLPEAQEGVPEEWEPLLRAIEAKPAHP